MNRVLVILSGMRPSVTENKSGGQREQKIGNVFTEFQYWLPVTYLKVSKRLPSKMTGRAKRRPFLLLSTIAPLSFYICATSVMLQFGSFCFTQVPSGSPRHVHKRSYCPFPRYITWMEKSLNFYVHLKVACPSQNDLDIWNNKAYHFR